MMPARQSSRRRWRAPFSRTLVAALALWLPLATAQGSSICSVATSIAAAKPHLGCHRDESKAASSAHDCCCQRTPQIRASACNCHDGQSPAGPTVSDPILAESAMMSALLADAGPADPAGAAFPGRAAGAPDPHPPKSVSVSS